MITRRKALTLLAGSAAAASTIGLVGNASAETRWDPIDQRWVKVNTSIFNRTVPTKYKRRNVNVNTDLAPGTIVIHTDKKFLYHVTSSKKAMRYGVGVGREGFTWKGNATIRRKAEWPSWTPPAEMRARERKKGIILPITQKGGIDNPLGARALYLYQGNRDTLYRIHGTNEPWSIGLNLSSGCIRLLNSDVEHLYENVKLGSKVVVIGPGESAAKVLKENTNPFAALFERG